MNRYLIYDRAESHWMHIGYDTKASANRAAQKMRKACGDPSRYCVVDQNTPDLVSSAYRRGALSTLAKIVGRKVRP